MMLVFISSLTSNFALPELTYQINIGVSHGVTFNLIPSHMGFCHRQISIQAATYSFGPLAHGLFRGGPYCLLQIIWIKWKGCSLPLFAQKHKPLQPLMSEVLPGRHRHCVSICIIYHIVLAQNNMCLLVKSQWFSAPIQQFSADLYWKYTNPAIGILDVCKQKFFQPLLSIKWTLFEGTDLSLDQIDSLTEVSKRKRNMYKTKKAPLKGGA